MKKILLLSGFILGSILFQEASAHLRISIRANIGSQPVWGPSGYDRAEYYYLPEIDVFYNVSRRQYVYEQRGRWVFSASLPRQYRNYNLYSGYKVVVNDNRPYRNAGMYRTKYATYKNNHNQESIRNSKDSRYFKIREHPEHNNWQNRNRRRN